MSKRKWQRVLGLLLCIMMFASLVGCGNQNKGTTAAPTDKGTEAPRTEAPGTDAPTDAPTEAPGITYPLETDVELSWWATTALKYKSAFQSADESPFHVGLSKNTGVKINWEFPQAGVSGGQAYNLMITAETLPDLIHYTVDAGAAEGYINDGLIWDLTDYLPEYAPDYWEWVNSDDALRRAATTASGKYHMIAGGQEAHEFITYQGLALRKDWLDECKLEIPVTLDDWEKVLTTFKDKYGATFSGPKLGFGMSSGTGAYADKSPAWYINDNDEVVFANSTDEYKAFLERMHKWYETGLMDPDIFTNDNTAIRNKCANNEVGAMYIGSGTYRNILADAETNGAVWVSVPHPVTKEGEKVTWIQTAREIGGGYGTMVSKSCSEEELKVALQLLNYAFTEEGMLYWNLGDEGVSYTVTNGEYAWTDLITKAEVGENTAYTYYVGTSSNSPAIKSVVFQKLLNKGEALNAIYQWTANSVAAEHYMPKLTLAEEKHTQYWDKFGSIYTYVEESVSKFIIGEMDLAKWDEYLKTLDDMGIEECHAIQKEAYELWLKK